MDRKSNGLPKCNSVKYVKDGNINGKQRYLCKNYGRRYTVKKRSTEKSEETKPYGFKTILRRNEVLGLWQSIKNKPYYRLLLGKEMWSLSKNLPKSKELIEIVELDELHTYIGNKKTIVWCGLLLTDFGKRLLDFVCDKRNTKTFVRLWKRLETKQVRMFCSDYWKSYQELIPRERPCQSKAETFTVEGYNSRIRHYLARFKRKSRCYSKSIVMIENSLKLLFLKLNNQLSIIT